jgi:hypothetical protein
LWTERGFPLLLVVWIKAGNLKRFGESLGGLVGHFGTSGLVLIRLFQPKADILGVVELSTTTAGGDLKGPDKPKVSIPM